MSNRERSVQRWHCTAMIDAWTCRSCKLKSIFHFRQKNTIEYICNGFFLNFGLRFDCVIRKNSFLIPPNPQRSSNSTRDISPRGHVASMDIMHEGLAYNLSSVIQQAFMNIESSGVNRQCLQNSESKLSHDVEKFVREIWCGTYPAKTSKKPNANIL